MGVKGTINRLKLRAKRQRRRARALRLRRQLKLVHNNTHRIGSEDIIAFITMHNELRRLPYFLDYYRKMGVDHFIFIDNNSNDGTLDYLKHFSDVSVYFTPASYRRSHYGMDWINYLLLKYGRHHWCLTVDVDEFLVYPHCDQRPLRALTDWLDASNCRQFSAQLLDLYPEKKMKNIKTLDSHNPFEVLTHFDVGNYTFKMNSLYQNLWIQGGARARLFFADQPDRAPALNKTPLVKWRRGQVYISSTHQLLPRQLNHSYSTSAQENLCGVLLHTKFLPDLQNKVQDPYLLSQHYSRAREYHSYNAMHLDDVNFMCPLSVKYDDWRQLVQLGIISQGGWA